MNPEEIFNRELSQPGNKQKKVHSAKYVSKAFSRIDYGETLEPTK